MPSGCGAAGWPGATAGASGAVSGLSAPRASCSSPDSNISMTLSNWPTTPQLFVDGELVGGLYGVAVGGLFAGESMFTRARDASKVALMGLVELLDDEYAGRRLLDTQWQTPHLATLGVREVTRRDYLRLLQQALAVPLPLAFR